MGTISTIDDLLRWILKQEGDTLPSPKGCFAVERRDKKTPQNGIGLSSDSPRKHWVVMTCAEYRKLHELIAKTKKRPPKIISAFPPFDSLEAVGNVRQMKYGVRKSAQRTVTGVVIPWLAFEQLFAWLEGRIGKGGGSARNLLDRELNPQPKDDTRPVRHPLLSGPIAHKPRATPQEQVLAEIETRFIVERVTPADTPSASRIRDECISSLRADELLADEDEPVSVWVLDDGAGYFAVLAGPEVGAAVERHIRRSLIGFTLPRTNLGKLRKTTSLRELMKSARTGGKGYLFVCDGRSGKPIGTLISLRLFAKAAGIAVGS